MVATLLISVPEKTTDISEKCTYFWRIKLRHIYESSLINGEF